MSIPNIPYNPMKNQSHKPRNKRREAQRNHRERQTTISQRASRPIESLLLPLVLCRLLYPGIGQGLPICPCWKQFQRLFMDFEPDPSNAPSRIGRFIEKDSLTRLRLVQTDFCGAMIRKEYYFHSFKLYAFSTRFSISSGSSEKKSSPVMRST